MAASEPELFKEVSQLEGTLENTQPHNRSAVLQFDAKNLHTSTPLATTTTTTAAMSTAQTAPSDVAMGGDERLASPQLRGHSINTGLRMTSPTQMTHPRLPLGAEQSVLKAITNMQSDIHHILISQSRHETDHDTRLATMERDHDKLLNTIQVMVERFDESVDSRMAKISDQTDSKIAEMNDHIMNQNRQMNDHIMNQNRQAFEKHMQLIKQLSDKMDSLTSSSKSNADKIIALSTDIGKATKLTKYNTGVVQDGVYRRQSDMIHRLAREGTEASPENEDTVQQGHGQADIFSGLATFGPYSTRDQLAGGDDRTQRTSGWMRGQDDVAITATTSGQYHTQHATRQPQHQQVPQNNTSGFDRLADQLAVLLDRVVPGTVLTPRQNGRYRKYKCPHLTGTLILVLTFGNPHWRTASPI